MDKLPFSVFWDKGNAVIIAWDWVSHAAPSRAFRAVHFFAELPNLPPVFDSNADGGNGAGFSYLTSIFVDRTDSGLQYFFSGETVVNTVHALIEISDGEFEEQVFTYQPANADGARPWADGAGGYRPVYLLNMHLGLLEIEADRDKLWPLVELQESSISPDGSLPSEVKGRIRDFSNSQPFVRHLYSLATESTFQHGSDADAARETHTALRLIHPVEKLVISSRFIHQRQKKPDSGKSGLSAAQRSFLSSNSLSLILRLEGRFQMLSEDWLDRIAIFVVHDSWVRSREAFAVAKDERKVFDDLLINMRELFGEQWIDENLFALNSGSHAHVSVKTIGDLVVENEAALLDSHDENVLEIDLSLVFGALSVGDRFGIVGSRNIKQNLSWGSGSRVLGTGGGAENPAATFRLLTSGIEECQGAEANTSDIHHARLSADARVNSGNPRGGRAYLGSPTFSIRLPIANEARDLAQGLRLIREEYAQVFTFELPSESEIAVSSLLEILSYLSLIEVAEASAQHYQRLMQLGSLAAHKHTSGAEHAMVSLGLVYLDASATGRVRRGPVRTLSLLLRALGIPNGAETVFGKWDMRSIASFVSMIENPENRKSVLAARLLPSSAEQFDARQYLEKCRKIEVRFGIADYADAIEWGLTQPEESEANKLASLRRDSAKGADGWLEIAVYDDLERLNFLLREPDILIEEEIEDVFKGAGVEISLQPVQGAGVSRGQDPKNYAQEMFDKILALDPSKEAPFRILFEGANSTKYKHRHWAVIASGFEKYLVKITLPTKLEILVGDVEKWAGAVDLVPKFQRNKGLGLEDRQLHDRIFGLLRRVPDSSPSYSRAWFEGTRELDALDQRMNAEITRVFGAASLLTLPENIPDRDAVTSYCRLLVCHRVTKDLDGVIARMGEAALMLARKGKLTQVLSERLLAIQWLRNALPQGLGHLYAQCHEALGETVSALEAARIRKPTGLSMGGSDLDRLFPAENQS